MDFILQIRATIPQFNELYIPGENVHLLCSLQIPDLFGEIAIPVVERIDVSLGAFFYSL